MKKGFTLVEMLGVIIILSLLMLISGVAITSIVKNSKEKLSDTQINNIKMAAQLWAENNMEELYDTGYLMMTADDLKNKNIIEIDNDVNIDNYITKIHMENGKITTDLIDYSIYDGCFETSEISNILSITGYRSYVNNDTSLEKCPTDVYIPPEINGKKIESIDSYSFSEKNLTNVLISDGVEKIHPYAFKTNKINFIKIPDSVNLIGVQAFNGNEIKKLEIKGNDLGIGTDAFSSNKIITVIIGRGVKIIYKNAFAHNQITTLDLSNAVDLEQIGNWAFGDNRLVSVTIPDSVTTIGPLAFIYNNLQKVTIGSGITSIGRSAFGHTANNMFSGENKIESVTININKDDSILGDSAFNWITGHNNDNIVWKNS